MASANRTARREAAILLAVLLAWAAAEGWIRMRAWRSGIPPFQLAIPARMTVSDRDLPFSGTPFLDVWSYAPSQDGQYVRIRTDGLGFRSPPVAVPKPSGVFRVVLMGDCGMQEVGAGTAEGYGPCTEFLRGLLARSRAETVEVVNAATGGYDLLTEVAQYLFKIRLLSPDLLIVEPEIFDSPNRPLRPDSARSAFDAPPLVQTRFRIWKASLALHRLEWNWAPAVDQRLRTLLDPAPAASLPSRYHACWTRDVCGELGALAALARHDGTRILVQPPSTWLRSASAEARIASGPWSAQARAELLDQVRQVRELDRAVADWARREGVPLVNPSRLPEGPEDFLTVEGFLSPYLLSRRGHARRALVLAEEIP